MTTTSTPATSGLKKLRAIRAGWHLHPGVRSGDKLTLGERSADAMRNGMGSWSFVFAALLFLAIWMISNGKHGFDPYPFILLNLVLSCLAALQGAILLIAAKRSDQVSSELAQHDYEADVRAEKLIEALCESFAELRRDHTALAKQADEMLAILRQSGLSVPATRSADEPSA
jgi:uncharacterized membrane protein